MPKRKKLDVLWILPNKKKPFGYSTIATQDLIIALYKEYKDLRIVYEKINYDENAKKIVKYCIDKGCYKIWV